MCHLHVLAVHNECIDYVLINCANKNVYSYLRLIRIFSKNSSLSQM